MDSIPFVSSFTVATATTNLARGSVRVHGGSGGGRMGITRSVLQLHSKKSAADKFND
jgi:hypothetical protein